MNNLLEQPEVLGKLVAWRVHAMDRLSILTSREREILHLVVAGHSSKAIARELGISPRTVEKHRATILRKTGSRCVTALARVALAAAWNGADEPFVEHGRLVSA
jgi:two-component system CheB/CheR fusion protein